MAGRGDHGWRVRVVPVTTDHGVELASLTLSPTGDLPPGGITRDVVRAVSVAELVVAVRRAAEQWQAFGFPPPEVDAYAMSRRPGPRGRDDLHYARWAALYVAALARSTTPVAKLAGQHNISTSRIRNILHAARRRGLLTEAPPGRPGGELTERARQLLAEKS